MENLLATLPVFLAAAISLLLAGIVLRHGLHQRPHQLLALVLFFLGFSWFGFAMASVTRAQDGSVTPEALFWVSYTYRWFIGIPVMFVLLAVATARRPPRPAWTHPLPYLLFVIAFAIAGLAWPELYGSDPAWGGGPLANIAWGLSIPFAIVPMVLLRRSFAAADPSTRERALLLSVGIATSVAFFAGRELVHFVFDPSYRPSTAAGTATAALFLAFTLGMLVLVAMTAAAGVREPAPVRSRYRLAAGVLAAAVGCGALSAAAWLGGLPVDRALAGRLSQVLWAVWMLAAPAILAYALLRGQLLDIDLKVRRGIKGGTVAAVFLAAFFVVSELAQQVLASTTGSAVVGIVATGGLVFALAPLQRLADRVATAAVPVALGAAAAPAVPFEKEDAYRNAVRFALRDRQLSSDEEIQLMDLADHLGLSARRAMELRVEVERNAEASASRGAAQ